MCDVFPVGEGEGVAGISGGSASTNVPFQETRIFSLCQVEDRHSISHWGEERVAVRREDQIPSAIDGAQEVGELTNTSDGLSGSCASPTYLELCLHCFIMVQCAYIATSEDSHCGARKKKLFGEKMIHSDATTYLVSVIRGKR